MIAKVMSVEGTWLDIFVGERMSQVVLTVRPSDEPPFEIRPAVTHEELERFAKLVSGEGLEAVALRSAGEELWHRIDGPDRVLSGRWRRLAGTSRARPVVRIACPMLPAFPWEALHDGERHLGASPEMVLVRAAPLRVSDVAGIDSTRADRHTPTEPIQVAFLVAQENDAALVRTYRVLQPLESQGLRLHTVKSAGAALGNVLHELRRIRPHILHVLAHGEISARGARVVLGPQGDEPLDFSALVDELSTKLGSLSLVLLESCHGADGGAGVSCAAELCARSGIPATVAHLGPVDSNFARAASHHFYRALLLSGDVARAVQDARRDLYAEQRAAHSMVAYLRFTRSRLFDFQAIPDRWRYTQAWDFSPYIHEKRAGFVGRAWLVARVRTWLSESKGRALLILADFGVGKTAFMAELASGAGLVPIAATYFCRAADDATLRPSTFVASLAAQLAERLPDYRKAVEGDEGLQRYLAAAEADPGRAMSQGVVAPLRMVPIPQQSYAVLIDAVDEALDLRGVDAKSQGTIVRLLATHAGLLPSWMRIVATSRHRAEITSPLAAAFVTEYIDADSSENAQDLQIFVAARVAQLQNAFPISPQASARFESELINKSRGKFLYAALVLDQVGRKEREIEDCESLPSDMETFYADSFTRRFEPARYRQRVAPLLGVLCAARAPVQVTELAAIVEIEAQESGEVLKELRDFLRLRPDGVALDHVSLKQWLTATDEELGYARAGIFAVDQAGAEQLIARWADRVMSEGRASESAYLVRWLPQHIRPGAPLPCYRRTLLDLRWLEARLGAVGALALMADFARLNLRDDRALCCLRNALDLSRRILHKRPSELRGQLVGRLHGINDVDLECLVSSARYQVPSPTLLPRSRCLSPPSYSEQSALVERSPAASRVCGSDHGGASLGAFDEYWERVREDDSFADTVYGGDAGWPVSIDQIALLALSATGEWAVSCFSAGILNVWSAETGAVVRTLKPRLSLRAIGVSEDGERVMALGWNGELHVWQADEVREVIETTPEQSDFGSEVEVDADGGRVRSLPRDAFALRVWERRRSVMISHQTATFSFDAPVDAEAVAAGVVAVGTREGDVVFFDLLLPV